MKLRLYILIGVFAFGLLGLTARLFFWQVVKSQELTTQARTQHQSGRRITADRGNILAADGSLLAASSQSWLLFIQKSETDLSTKAIANKLAPILVEEIETKPDDTRDAKQKLLDETNRIQQMLDRADLVWVPIKHKLSADVKRNIEALKIKGAGFDPEESRFYPEGSSSAHVLGFVGKDQDGIDKGYFGLEGFYDLSLTGKPGFVQQESDAKGTPILFGGSKEISALSGVDLKTHIDKRMQFIVEEKLKEGIDRYGAKSGVAIIMDPKTGAIMSMAAFPSYDPAKYFEFGNEYFKNPVISDAFEPGSIFKPLIMASGLDSGSIEVDTICDICGGPLKIDKYYIETWNNKYNANSSMTDIIVHSDNVGMSFIGQKMGQEKLYDYLRKFGFGQITGIDLQGEASPALRPKDKWNIVDLATATFGQGIAVTPIQMIQAFSAIANKGKMVAPQIVDKIITDKGEQAIKQPAARQIVSEKSAAETTAMMVEAVEAGEAKWTKLQGFKVAGKTGTAQIPIGGHYDAEKTIASFVGFAPAKDPKFIMLITLQEPQTSTWASETAAPLWFNIAKELFPYMGIQPENQ